MVENYNGPASTFVFLHIFSAGFIFLWPNAMQERDEEQRKCEYECKSFAGFQNLPFF